MVNERGRMHGISNHLQLYAMASKSHVEVPSPESMQGPAFTSSRMEVFKKN